eukprot:scaffold21361_cov57-Phaeocystis_antarctica.AAC.1
MRLTPFHQNREGRFFPRPVFGKRNLPRTRLYHWGKPIGYALTSLTIWAVRPASVARARRLASSSREPAAALAAPRASLLPSSNAVARGRDSLAPRAEPRGDSYRARSLSSVSRAR